MAQIVSSLVQDQDVSDPEIAEKATEICKKVSNIYQRSLENETFPTTLASQTREVVQTTMSCGEKDTKENPNIFKTNTTQNYFQIPVENIEIDDKIIPETIPDYDDSILDKKINYQKATENFVGICENNLKAISFTSVEGEKMININNKECEVYLTKMSGKKLAEEQIGDREEVTILPPQDFRNIPETIESFVNQAFRKILIKSFHFQVCTWKHDIFWWNPENKKSATKIVFVKFRQSGDLTIFKEPLKIILKLNLSSIKQHELEFTSTNFRRENDILVIRVDVEKNQSFSVKFHDLTETDFYSVLISDFHKIRLEDLQNRGKIITKEENIIFQEHNHEYDGWHYISVIPNLKKVGIISFKPNLTESFQNFDVKSKISISVFTTGCYYWNKKGVKWDFGCKVCKTGLERSFTNIFFREN